MRRVMWDADVSSEPGSGTDGDAAVSLAGRELEYVALRRRLRGYDRSETDQLLADVATRYEELWRDRAGLQEKLDEMAAEAARHRELERQLRDTLRSVQQAADDLRGQTRTDYESLLDEARARVVEQLGAADAERKRAEARIRRLQDLEHDFRESYRGVLLTALERLESAAGDGQAADPRLQERLEPSSAGSGERPREPRSRPENERSATSKLLDEIRARLKLDDARTRSPRSGAS